MTTRPGGGRPASRQVGGLAIGMALGLSLSACANPVGPMELPVTLDAREAQTRLQPGPNTLQGRLLFRYPQGGMATCAGGRVMLIPATAFSRAWADEFFGPDSKTGLPAGQAFKALNEPFAFANSERFLSLTHSTYCNTDSRFSFTGVADGEFQVLANVLWRRWGHPMQVGALISEVRVAGGQTVEVRWPETALPLAPDAD